jgi:hypothetical protein
MLAPFVPFAACNDAKTHVYGAQFYEQAQDCLDDYAALDVVQGETASSRCDPVCLVGGAGYYVSAVCAPYPTAFTVSASDAATDPVCAAAIAAFVAGKSCTAPAADGGDDGGDGAGDDGAGDDGAGDDGSGDAGSGDAPTD